MEKAYKYRIYPNKKQKELIAKNFGCVRFVYNHYLAKRIEAYKNNKETLNYYDCANDLKNLKSNYEWLKEADSTSLQSTIKDLDTAYQKFFKEHSGFPKFKSKKTHRYAYKSKRVGNNIEFCGNSIKLPKLGKVKIKGKQIPQGRILNATVSQVPSGKYYVSLCCTEVEAKQYESTENAIGIDLGLKEFAITSNGDKIENPKYLKKSLQKLAKLQRGLSRKTKGRSNWNKARIEVARMQERIANQRKDFLQNYLLNLLEIMMLFALKICKSRIWLKTIDLHKQSLMYRGLNLQDSLNTKLIGMVNKLSKQEHSMRVLKRAIVADMLIKAQRTCR